MIDLLLQQIDIVVIALVILGGIFAKNYLSNINIPVAVKTLAVASIFVLCYIGVLVYSGDFDRKDLPRFFLSYCVATSLYELLLKYVLQKLTEKLK